MYSGLRMYLNMLIGMWRWQFCILYSLAQFNIRSSITVVIRHKLWTKVSLCLVFYKKLKCATKKDYNISTRQMMNAEGRGQKWSSEKILVKMVSGTSGIFNRLIIVKLLIGFAADGNFVVGYEQREWTWLMNVLWRSPSWWSGKSWKGMQV